VQFFIKTQGKDDIKSFLPKIGWMPLPGYIKRKAVKADETQYQTVYAEKNGAVAAPTAGLHFTDRLLKGLRESGIIITFITLHIGYGTFKPVTAENVISHHMDEEYYEIPQGSADIINSAIAEKRRIIAVGTSVTRALESSFEDGRVRAESGSTSLFIYPGYEFKVINGMVTNFHLPRSSPLILVSALAGLEKIKKAYAEAIEKGYRFYSYGDAMLII
jgi:S-adenosylmethionine:tRNA ribosyltransferase-isomerase